MLADFRQPAKTWAYTEILLAWWLPARREITSSPQSHSVRNWKITTHVMFPKYNRRHHDPPAEPGRHPMDPQRDLPMHATYASQSRDPMYPIRVSMPLLQRADPYPLQAAGGGVQLFRCQTERSSTSAAPSVRTRLPDQNVAASRSPRQQIPSSTRRLAQIWGAG